MDLSSLGATIRERREDLGLTQSRLAQLSGLSRQTLVGLEAGALRDLGFNRVGHLLSVLGLEAPVPLVGMAVEEAAEKEGVEPKFVWRNVAKLAKALALHRQSLWA